MVTEGVFTRMVLDDPSLDGVAAVLFDEFHERSLDADLGLALARDLQQGLREELKLLVMSATIDGARIGKLLGGAPVIESAGRAFPVDDPLSRPRSASADRAASRRRGAAGPARRDRIGAGVPARRRGDPPHRDGLARAHRRSGYRRGAALWRARRRRPGPRHRAGAARPPQGRARHVDCRNLADHRGRAGGDRFGPRAGAALRARRRLDQARDRAGVARLRRPAARPRRAHRARHLLSAVGRAADRFARARDGCGNPRRRSHRLRARSRPLGRRRSGRARLPRSAAGARDQRGQDAARRAWRHRPRGPHHRGGQAVAAIAAAAAARAHGGRCRRRGRSEARRRYRAPAHRARPRRQRRRSVAPPRRVAPRPLAPGRGGAGDGEALGGHCEDSGDGADCGKGRALDRRHPGARLSGSRRQEPRRRRRLSARQWPRRQRRSGVAARARAVPRRCRDHRQRRARAHRAGGAADARRDRDAVFRPDRESRRDRLRRPQRKPACPPPAPPRRHRAGRAADAGRADRCDRPHARGRHRAARHRPVAVEQGAAPMARPRRVPAAGGRRRMAGPLRRRAGGERG